MSTHETGGGGGEPTRGDFVMQEQAIRQRWNVTPEMRDQILKTAMAFCTGTTPDGRLKRNSRVAIAAMRVVIAVDKLSLEQTKLEAKAPRPAAPAAEAADVGGDDDDGDVDSESVTDEEAKAYLIKVNGEPEFVLDRRILPDDHPRSPGTIRPPAAVLQAIADLPDNGLPWWERSEMLELERKLTNPPPPRRGPESVCAGGKPPPRPRPGRRR